MYKHVISALYVYKLNAFRKSEAIKIFYIMYTLNFPNGNVQTYASQGELEHAARLLGGEAKIISGKTYAFVPKK